MTAPLADVSVHRQILAYYWKQEVVYQFCFSLMSMGQIKKSASKEE